MRPSRVRPLLVVATALTLFVFAFPTVLADLGPGPLFYYRLLVFPADLTLAITLLAAVAVGLRERIRPGIGTTLLGALTVALGIALVAHPSAQGVFSVARFAGVTGLAFAVSLLTRDERLVAVSALGVVAVSQVGLAIAQVLNGGPLGLASFGEIADPLLSYGPLAPRGTMHGQQVLAGLGLVAALLLVRESFDRRRPLAWDALAGVAVMPVGMTFARAAALGVGLACAALALGIRKQRRLAVAAIACLALGAGLTAIVFRDGWELKGSAVAGSLNGRDILAEESFALIASSPLVGIGPGRSVIVLRERYPEPPDIVGYQPAHDLPLLAAVEGGVLAGGLAVALLVALGWRARRDIRALALFAAFITVVLTDHYPYTYLQGLVLLGVWIGALDGLGRE